VALIQAEHRGECIVEGPYLFDCDVTDSLAQALNVHRAELLDENPCDSTSNRPALPGSSISVSKQKRGRSGRAHRDFGAVDSTPNVRSGTPAQARMRAQNRG
jgi:hypothetical protein